MMMNPSVHSAPSRVLVAKQPPSAPHAHSSLKGGARTITALPSPSPRQAAPAPAPALPPPDPSADSGSIPMTALHTDNQSSSLPYNNISEKTLTVDASIHSTKTQTRTTPSYGTEYPRDLAPDKAEDTSTNTEPAQHTSAQHTPNVYINGLPPHFSEQDLFALTRPFGEVKSVRTFTRHVSEKPTGYGFVLFDDISSAERCIEGLRKYRNLHPSFSKQVHRIPGTIYAQQNIAQPTDQDPNSFKARMEKLKDESSTNLYIEGLPLSIDDESLASLMAPFKIKSSRFFKTKLSDPPRIIAFVRLETRAAAEETIERLHGRMVRGWNDPGCRISVRFADSPEQRELRRAERVLKTGDQSPSRLTIAQAALLNLHGQELQAESCGIPEPSQQSDIPLGDKRGAQSLLLPQDSPEYFPGPKLSISTSLPANMGGVRYGSPVLDANVSADMDVLLQSMQSLGMGDAFVNNLLGSTPFCEDNPSVQLAALQSLANGNAGLGCTVPVAPLRSRGQIQARNGFTPAEELILQAHARRLQLQAQFNGACGFEPEPVHELPTPVGQDLLKSQLHQHTNRVPTAPGQCYPGRLRATKSLQDFLPTISEDDSRPLSEPWLENESAPKAVQGLFDNYFPGSTAGTKLAKPVNRAVRIVPPTNRNDERETPRDYSITGMAPIGMDRAPPRSASMPNCQTLLSRPSLNDSQSYQQATPSNNSTTVNVMSSSIHVDTGYSGDAAWRRGERPHSDLGAGAAVPVVNPTVPSSHVDESSRTSVNGPKSPAVSPALTYSSRTPSTLSPPTPFFGSFGCVQDTFEVAAIDEDAIEKDMKVKTRPR
ncbi:hypothetical protein ID866_7278 [Astraeus odoratus]|nr:hypothetical protein ID866_7278 [Astraeus odoratus]